MSCKWSLSINLVVLMWIHSSSLAPLLLNVCATSYQLFYRLLFFLMCANPLKRLIDGDIYVGILLRCDSLFWLMRCDRGWPWASSWADVIKPHSPDHHSDLCRRRVSGDCRRVMLLHEQLWTDHVLLCPRLWSEAAHWCWPKWRWIGKVTCAVVCVTFCSFVMSALRICIKSSHIFPLNRYSMHTMGALQWAWSISWLGDMKDVWTRLLLCLFMYNFCIIVV